MNKRFTVISYDEQNDIFTVHLTIDAKNTVEIRASVEIRSDDDFSVTTHFQDESSLAYDTSDKNIERHCFYGDLVAAIQAFYRENIEA